MSLVWPPLWVQSITTYNPAVVLDIEERGHLTDVTVYACPEYLLVIGRAGGGADPEQAAWDTAWFMASCWAGFDAGDAECRIEVGGVTWVTGGATMAAIASDVQTPGGRARWAAGTTTDVI